MHLLYAFLAYNFPYGTFSHLIGITNCSMQLPHTIAIIFTNSIHIKKLHYSWIIIGSKIAIFFLSNYHIEYQINFVTYNCHIHNI